MKTIVVLIVMISLVTVSSNIFAISSNQENESGDQYHFTDVEVLVFGRCRGRFSDGSWTGRLFIGNIRFCGVTNNDNFLERFTILVRNQSSGEIFLKLRLQYYDIQFVNATGVFFWGRKGSGVSNLIPIVFIRCHAEKLAVSEGPWGPTHIENYKI